MTEMTDVLEIVRQANPVPDPEATAEQRGASRSLLAAIDARSHDRVFKAQPSDSIRPPYPKWYRRRAVIFVAAAAAMIVVMVPVLLSRLSDDIGPTDRVPATQPAPTGTLPATTAPPAITATTNPDVGGVPGWVETKLTASDGRDEDLFGWAVAVDGDRVVVGAMGRLIGEEYVGKVYVFDRDDDEWVETKLSASDGADGGQFGMSVAVDGDRIVVGRPFASGEQYGWGAAYVFDRNTNGQWIETKLTSSDLGPGDSFGSSVAVHGDRVVIGAGGDDEDSGSVYVFDRDDNGEWGETKLTASDRAPGHALGFLSISSGTGWGLPVAVEENRIAVGSRAGVYVFEADGQGEWAETKLRTAGSGVAVDGDRIVIVNGRTVHVFEPDGSGGWAETTVDIPEPGQQLAAADGRIVIAAYPVPNGPNAGQPGPVYILDPDGKGGWTETKLTVPADSANYSSIAVAVDGDRVVLGNASAGSRLTGVAYVYEAAGD